MAHGASSLVELAIRRRNADRMCQPQPRIARGIGRRRADYPAGQRSALLRGLVRTTYVLVCRLGGAAPCPRSRGHQGSVLRAPAGPEHRPRPGPPPVWRGHRDTSCCCLRRSAISYVQRTYRSAAGGEQLPSVRDLVRTAYVPICQLGAAARCSPRSRTYIVRTDCPEGSRPCPRDLTPDQDIDYLAPLEKGSSGQAPRRQTVPAPVDATVKRDPVPATPDPGPTTKPDPGPTTKPDPAPATKPEPRPDPRPPEDDCVEMPCIKTNIDFKAKEPGGAGSEE